jgi:hypothetical protein
MRSASTPSTAGLAAGRAQQPGAALSGAMLTLAQAASA